MQHITITPTLANQRVLATLVLKSKLRDGWHVDWDVFDWALTVLKTSDRQNDEYIESFRKFKAIVSEFTRSLIWAIANNNFEVLLEIPSELESQYRLICEYTKVIPSIIALWGKPEDLSRAINNLVKRQIRPVLCEWADANIDSQCPTKSRNAQEINHAELERLLGEIDKSFQ